MTLQRTLGVTGGGVLLATLLSVAWTPEGAAPMLSAHAAKKTSPKPAKTPPKPATPATPAAPAAQAAAPATPAAPATAPSATPPANAAPAAAVPSTAAALLAGAPNTVNTIFAPAGSTGSADGPAGQAAFDLVTGMAVRGTTVYIADRQNYAVRVLDLNKGTVSTLFGGRDRAGSEDGPFATAKLGMLSGISVHGDFLLVTEDNEKTVRKIDLAAGTITTLAGKARERGNLDGVGTAARLEQPRAPVSDGKRVFFADAARVRAVDLVTLEVKTLAGERDADCTFGFQKICKGGYQDGVGNEARFTSPSALALRGDTLYIADNGMLRALDLPSLRVSTVVGQKGGKVQDGAGAQAGLSLVGGMLIAGDKMIVAERGMYNRLRLLELSGYRIGPLTGHKFVFGGSGDTDGPAQSALFDEIAGIGALGKKVLVIQKNGKLRALHLP